MDFSGLGRFCRSQFPRDADLVWGGVQQSAFLTHTSGISRCSSDHRWEFQEHMALKNSILPTLPNWFLVFFILHKWHRNPPNCSSLKPKTYQWFLHFLLPHPIHYQVLFILSVKRSLNRSFSLSAAITTSSHLGYCKTFLTELAVVSPASSYNTFFRQQSAWFLNN